MLSRALLTSENDVALHVQDEPLYEIVDGQRVDVPPMSVYTTWLASRLMVAWAPMWKSMDLAHA